MSLVYYFFGTQCIYNAWCSLTEADCHTNLVTLLLLAIFFDNYQYCKAYDLNQSKVSWVLLRFP